ncbi:MAG: transporter substrate-binding domain-containing protein [Anaerolineales bacterium]|nr:transporter substrate-binding domain-containing protein [Anaerolineales bacterium]
MKKILLLGSIIILSALVVSCGAPSTPTPAPTAPPAQANNTNDVKGLQIFTEEFPPVNFSKDGKATGLGTEVVEEILKRQGLDVTIQVVPWARGYRAAQDGPMTVLFVATRTEQREKLFKWVGPVVTQTTSFYALKDSNITLTSLDDAKKIDIIGVVADYYSQQYLTKEGFANLDISTDNDPMIRKLLAGRLPLIVSENISLPALLAISGAKLEDVRLVYTFMTSQNYIAFSLDTPDELVQQWQASLDEMKADGAFAQIYEKWLPGSVPPP